MSTSYAGGPRRRWLTAWAVAVGHYSTQLMYVALALGGVLLVVETATGRHSRISLAVLVLTSVTWAAVTAAAGLEVLVHDRTLCPRHVADPVLLNPQLAVQRRRRELYRVYRLRPVAVAVVGTAALIGVVWSIGLPPPFGLLYLPCAAVFGYMQFMLATHSRLQPWCPWCRGRGGWGDLSFNPEPAPDPTARVRG